MKRIIHISLMVEDDRPLNELRDQLPVMIANVAIEIARPLYGIKEIRWTRTEAFGVLDE